MRWYYVDRMRQINPSVMESSWICFIMQISWTVFQSNAKGSKDTSKTIQNKLLNCINIHIWMKLQLKLKGKILQLYKEMRQMTTCSSQFLIILQHVISNEPLEKFIKFVKVENRTSEGQSSVLTGKHQ